MIFPSSAAHLALSILKNHQIGNAKSLETMKKNLSIILFLKWPLLEPEMFTVHCALELLKKGENVLFIIYHSNDQPLSPPKIYHLLVCAKRKLI